MDNRITVLLLIMGPLIGCSSGNSYNPHKLQKRDARSSVPTIRNNLEEVYAWKVLRYKITGSSSRNIPSANRVYFSGLSVAGNRIFLSTGRVFGPVPASISVVPKNTTEKSPFLQPYPSWDWHREAATGDTISNCEKSFVNVYRSDRDKCNRMWILDSGVLYGEGIWKMPCPPKIVVFDLKTDQVVKTIMLPTEVVRPNSVFDSIALDDSRSEYNENTCNGVYVYMLDTLDPAIVVHDTVTGRFWRRTNTYMNPDPNWSDHYIAGEKFTTMVGIRDMTIGKGSQPNLYVQAVSSNKIYSISISDLRQENAPHEIPMTVAIVKPCESIGLDADMYDGSLVYSPFCESTLLSVNPKNPRNTRLLASSQELLQAVHDIRPDHADFNVKWLISTREQKYYRNEVNTNEFNQRVLRIRLR